MVSRQPERYIPDVRDVFQRQSNGRGPTVGQQQQQPPQQGRYLFRDEHSDEEHYDYNGRTTKSNSRSGGGGGGGAVASPPRQKRNNNNNNGNSEHSMLGRNNDYSKTLTEKDLKHIERHLSMKKTIRKQLSRHLSKAFVESEAEAIAGQPTAAATTTTKAAAITPSRSHHPNGPNNSSSSTSANYSLTFNKSNVAKSESNFLDLLKEAGNDEFDGDDSGHCSPTTEMDRARMMDQQWLTNRFNSSSSLNPTTSRNNNVSAAASAPEGNEAKKSNFWKKLTVRSKSKR